MSRVYKSYHAWTGSGDASGTAKIDSGADRTLLRLETACQLGLDPARAATEEARTAGGGKLIGYRLPVYIQIGDRAAVVNAFVPTKRVINDTLGSETYGKVVVKSELIGHDFLQQAHAKLDYAERGREFSGPLTIPDEWIYRPATARETAYLRKSTRCRPPTRRRR